MFACVPSGLRILHVIDTLGRGGAEQALVNVLPLLCTGNHVAEVAVLGPPYELAPDLENRGVAVHRLDLFHPWSVPQGMLALTTLGRRRHYDIMHAHAFISAIHVAASKPLLPHVRRFVTFHCLEYDICPPDTPWLKVRKRLHAALMRRAMDVHLAVSKPVARHHEAHIGLSHVDVQYNGISVDTQFTEPRSVVRARHGVPPNVPLLVFCGRLTHEKGHRYFLEALSQLRLQGLAFRAAIVGQGPLRASLAEEIERRGLGAEVALHDPLPHDRLMDLFGAADAVVMASTHEGFPLVPAEAMALERAVVATQVGGIPELIEDGVSGILVPPGDPTALTQAIARVLSDLALRATLGVNGKMRLEKLFSSKAIAAQLLDRYQSVLARRSIASPLASG